MADYDDPITGLTLSYTDEDDSMLLLPPQSPLDPRHPIPDKSSSDGLGSNGLGIGGSGIGGTGGAGGGGGGGLGSLADELAGALDDSEEEEEEYGEEYGGEGGEAQVAAGGSIPNGAAAAATVSSSLSSSPTNGIVNGSSAAVLSIPPENMNKSILPRSASYHHHHHYHQRPPSASDYDGSDYGDPDNGISLALEDKITQIERLAARNRVMLKEEDFGDSETAGVVPRILEGLQKLAPQSLLETGSSRLITAHSALSSHMLHQTRSLRDLTFNISPTTLPPEDTADILLTLIDLIPRPTLLPLSELRTLHSLTLSLISQLSFLSDSLHMARQSSIAANRKLRVAKEACADWKGELEAVEKARRWIEEGDWDARCRRREAAGVCAEVLGGFEKVCGRFEERLRAQGVVAG